MSLPPRDRELEGTCPRPGTSALVPRSRCLLPSATRRKAEQSPTALHLVSRHTRSVCKAFSPRFSAKSLRVELKNPQGCPRVGISRRASVIFSCLISGAWCKLVQKNTLYI